MKNKYFLLIIIFIFGCSNRPKDLDDNQIDKKKKFYEGTIIISGEIITPLIIEKFEKQYHFSDTIFKYEYKEENKTSGLIINYKTQEVTCYASEDTVKRKFTTSIKYFIEKTNKLNFFEDCVDRIFSRIYLPEFNKKTVDYGIMKDTNFDLLSYQDSKGNLEIFDLKINIPGFVKEVSFINLPGEVVVFPLLNKYQIEQSLWDKILLKTSKINITNTEINELNKDIDFSLPEEFKNVKEISYSIYDESNNKSTKRSKSLFDEFDD